MQAGEHKIIGSTDHDALQMVMASNFEASKFGGTALIGLELQNNWNV